MKKAILTLTGAMLTLCLAGRPAWSSEPPVAVASIAPLQVLLTQVMLGVSEPEVILPSGTSPHHYALRPSDVARLDQAGIIFWVGPALEGALVNPIRALRDQSRAIALQDVDSIHLLDRREGGILDHDGHDDHDDHEAGSVDPHLWLDPRMAGDVMVIMAEVLAETDPGNASVYEHNARTGQAILENTVAEISTYLEPVRRAPYVVFHDAYQYFEHRFGLSPVAIVSVDSDRPPGARRIAQIHDLLGQHPGACVFVEPQFTPKLVETLREGTDTRSAVLDPMGMDSGTGLTGYQNTIWALARSLKECLE